MTFLKKLLTNKKKVYKLTVSYEMVQLVQLIQYGIQYDKNNKEVQMCFESTASGKAIYEQIMEQVKEAAWKGYLKPGDALPSVRKLALSLSVTPNTVAKAYQLLEKEKVIITIRGKGAFLAENASQEVDKGKMQEIKTSLKEILSELRYEGYDEEKIASLIHEIYQDLEG